MAQVKVSEGVLEGEILEGSLGGTYYSFKGIPYAQPPLGDLRFKAPQPAKPWKGIRNAKEHGSPCYQYDMWSQSIIKGSEDCLYLNVYTPNLKPTKPLSVMIWIHGGGFISGSGDSDFYGPDFLMPKEVILVTFNYRLEVVGFLCLNTEDIPGNAGMKDQVAALRWVKNNIGNFGGDPKNITIFGESSGAGCVSYHLISPITKGLFKRAIIQSGSANSQWARSFRPRARAVELARQLGCQSEDDKELYEFFKRVPIESLVGIKAPITMSEELQPSVHLHFSVVDEKKFGNIERFFYGDIFKYLVNGIHEGVDVIIGYVADEGYINYGLVPVKYSLTTFNKYIESYCPLALSYKLPVTDQLEIGTKIKEHYYGKDNVSMKKLRPLAKFFGFNVFNFDILQWVKFCAKKGANDVYFYKFSFVSERNIMVEMLGAKDAVVEADKPIVCHADDIMYLFDNRRAGVPVDTKAQSFTMIKSMTALWSNFAKYGNPTPDSALGVKWLPYSLADESYLDIGVEGELKLLTSPDKEEFKFWESIYEQYSPQNLAIRCFGLPPTTPPPLLQKNIYSEVYLL